MLRFPWRKRWLVGFDLEGNTFWEFKDALHALRNRRIAKYHRSTHYGDVNVSRASFHHDSHGMVAMTATANNHPQPPGCNGSATRGPTPQPSPNSSTTCAAAKQ
jgi:hypothetical protein